jgi:argininosuccinate synthase
MKSRGVYEAPGMTILYEGSSARLSNLTLDRDLMHLRDRLAPEVAEMVYYGFWYHAKMDALMAFIREAQQPVTGQVTLKLYKGNIMVSSRSSPNSLYDEGIATMEGGGSVQPDRRRRILENPGPSQPRSSEGAAKALLSLRAGTTHCTPRLPQTLWPKTRCRRLRVLRASRLLTRSHAGRIPLS